VWEIPLVSTRGGPKKWCSSVFSSRTSVFCTKIFDFPRRPEPISAIFSAISAAVKDNVVLHCPSVD
jgi:hypothetical protein